MDAWAMGYNDAHDECDDRDLLDYSYLFVIDYHKGRSVHDAFCGEHE